ncbi:hypothetical protein ILUMI_06014, partial [Ignelater luminosus]
MSVHQRTMEATIANRENLNTRPGKASFLKPAVTKRPVLGDVDNNKIHNKEINQSNVNKKPIATTKVGPTQVPKQPTVKLQNPTVKPTTRVVLRKTETTEKKTEIINKTRTTTTLKRQESTVLKHVVHVANDHKIGEETAFSSKQLLGVIDVDANNKGDPFLVTEYIQDIFCHLRSLEQDHKIRENHLSTHRSTPRMRSVLVNWMVDVHINFKFLLETLHLSVAILDRYLQVSTNVGRESLQLVGTAAMLIAGKYEEMYIPEIGDFVYICDNTFTSSELLKMEVDILCKLKWNLGRPLSIHFLRRYNKVARTQAEHHNLAKYFLEICLLEYELCHINPSIQAAAACCLSISILNEVFDPSKVWTKTLVHYSTYSYSDIKPV